MLELPPGKIAYSPMERKIFSILARGKQISSTVLMERVYRDTVNEHFHARETVNATLHSLRRKLTFNKAPVALRSTELLGPRPKHWWLEKKR